MPEPAAGCFSARSRTTPPLKATPEHTAAQQVMRAVLAACWLVGTVAFAPPLQTHQLHARMGVGVPSAAVGVTQVHGVSRHLSVTGKSAILWSPPSSPLRTQTRRGAAAAGRLRMQEKKADVFETATVLSNAEACDGMRLLKLKVPPAIAASYKVGGQYIKARADSGQEKPGFYAMCSAPGSSSDTFEFLIKRTPANDWGPGSGWICDLAEGAALELTEANGNGYKFADIAGDVTDVLLFATGSGIAPLKATLESGVLKGKSVKMYYGCRREDSMPFSDRFDAWGKECTVVPSLSQPAAGWSGKTGYIQDALKADGIPDAKKTCALLCGVKGMTEGVKDVLKEAGVPDANVLFNF